MRLRLFRGTKRWIAYTIACILVLVIYRTSLDGSNGSNEDDKIGGALDKRRVNDEVFEFRQKRFDDYQRTEKDRKGKEIAIIFC